MKTVYSVVKNCQGSDSYSWWHFIGKEVISYHKTYEGAKKKVAELLVLEGYTSNVGEFIGGSDWEKTIEMPIFDVVPIQLEP